MNGTRSGEQVLGNDGKMVAKPRSCPELSKISSSFIGPLIFTPRPHELLGVPGRETLV